MNKQEYIKFHEEFCRIMVDVTKKKNADYTGGGDDPFNNFRHIGNFIGTTFRHLPHETENVIEIDTIAVGFLTRMSDKFSRIGSFISKGELQVKDESVIDTLLDLANYSALFAGYLESKNKEPEANGTPWPLGRTVIVEGEVSMGAGGSVGGPLLDPEVMPGRRKK